MKLRALLVMVCLGLASFSPALAKDKRPKSTNPNVKRAMRKAKKIKPTSKYKAPKANKKPKRATYGVAHT